MRTAILVVFLLLAATAPANAQWFIYIEQVEHAPGTATLLVLPDGTGPAFDHARDERGNVVDATVLIQIVTDDGSPIGGFPAEDVWLSFSDSGNFARCGLGASIVNPDGPSSPGGWMLFSSAVHGGGWSVGPARFYINGSPAMHRDWSLVDPVPLRLNSPDLNGDGRVNLTDVAFFSTDYLGSYAFRSDLNADGDVGLVDLFYFASARGRSCP